MELQPCIGLGQAIACHDRLISLFIHVYKGRAPVTFCVCNISSWDLTFILIHVCKLIPYVLLCCYSSVGLTQSLCFCSKRSPQHQLQGVEKRGLRGAEAPNYSKFETHPTAVQCYSYTVRGIHTVAGRSCPLPVPFVFRPSTSNYSWWSFIDHLFYTASSLLRILPVHVTMHQLCGDSRRSHTEW